MSKLFIVATPIGNLSDMTFRAVETLKSVDFVVAEDTRHSGILFKKYDISTPLKSFHAQSSDTKLREIITEIAKEKSAAYISDAGTPCISDPGFRLVRLAVEQGIEILPIPGASALTALVSVAGVPADSFVFHGFLPHKKGRQTILKNVSDAKIANVFYESVHRFPKLLKELGEFVGSERVMVVGREMTKMHEEVFRGTVAEALLHFGKENTKGEFVVLIAPSDYKMTK
ncbi:16S rRNA (cytidine(1402)-2'-O)-methyltransferase [Candidatus Gracilibacteria bacterium]|nr:16S rRNA (cytidine(1402)-2'-O)-methyltransferase [Candidatus Gracilibacteria bacterium]